MVHMFVSVIIVEWVVHCVLSDVPDKEYSSLLYFPLVQNETNFNYYEMQVHLNGEEYHLPINLMNNSIVVAFNEKVANTDLASPQSYSLFENYQCVYHSSFDNARELSLTTSNNTQLSFNYIPYQNVDKYASQCNYRQYIGLGKSNVIIKNIQEQKSKIVKANEFSISLNNKGKGLLIIGEHIDMVKEYDPLFCRPIEEPTAQGRWGCQIRGALPEDNLMRLQRKGILTVDTDLRSGKEYFLTAKKTAAQDRYQLFYFDMNFQYILCTYKFLIYLKNFYFKQFIGNDICEIRNNTVLNILAFYCDESITTSLQPIHFLIGYRTVKFTAADLFVRDRNANNKKEYMFQVVGRSNKRGSEWIFGQVMFKKYTVMFNQDSQMVYVLVKASENTVNVHYSYHPPKSGSVPDVEVDVEEELFDVDINGQNDDLGVDDEKRRFNRRKLVAFSVGLVCTTGIFYLMYYRISYTKRKGRGANLSNEVFT